MTLYDYEVRDDHIEFKSVAATPTRVHYELSFPSPASTRWEEGKTVYGDYFLPQSAGKVPLVIITHAYGDVSLAPCITLARLLVKQGIASVIWYLPVDSRRLPAAMKGNYFPSSAGEWLDIYRSSVIELRRIVDWASSRDEVDKSRIAVAGSSMGGMISSIAMAVDARISAGIFVVIGGNMAELSWGGKLDSVSPGHTCSREECLAIYEKFPGFLKEVTEKGLENAVPAKECFLYDPLTFANRLRSRHVLMINGENDEVVSKKCTMNLWEALEKPPIIWVPDSHVGTYCQSALLSTEITNFLGSIIV